MVHQQKLGNFGKNIIGINIRKHISAVCGGKRKTASGYGWEYIN